MDKTVKVLKWTWTDKGEAGEPIEQEEFGLEIGLGVEVGETSGELFVSDADQVTALEDYLGGSPEDLVMFLTRMAVGYKKLAAALAIEMTTHAAAREALARQVGTAR